VAKRKKNKAVVIPKEIVYALILSLIAGGWGAYQQLQRIDIALRTLQAEVRLLTE
jgi:hypothetical protein